MCFTFNSGGPYEIPLDIHNSSPWRPIIAAVAEMEWRKIAEENSAMYSGPYVEDVKSIGYALAWRKWGEQ